MVWHVRGQLRYRRDEKPSLRRQRTGVTACSRRRVTILCAKQLRRLSFLSGPSEAGQASDKVQPDDPPIPFRNREESIGKAPPTSFSAWRARYILFLASYHGPISSSPYPLQDQYFSIMFSQRLSRAVSHSLVRSSSRINAGSRRHASRHTKFTLNNGASMYIPCSFLSQHVTYL